MQPILLDNRYELEHKLGEGGMATVYRGRDQRLNRRVAIKVLHSHYAGDPDFLQRFEHEAQAAALLNHPNVVNVYDVGQDGTMHYIVMEYVEGTNLKTLINQSAPLPVDQAVTIAADIARGLAAAHKLGLIHRDIKPQNIMIETGGQVHITDFGIAKSNFSSTLTQTGITFGTADYISPEQARGERATPQSDIYALGVTLYEMLTGRLPFIAENAVAVAMQHVSAVPPSPRQFNPQVPAQLETLVLRTMSKNPVERPANAEEFARLLTNYRSIATQDTTFNPNLMQRPAPPRPINSAAPPPPPVSAGSGSGGGSSSSSTSGRMTVPPPRPAVARAPRQQGPGCGTFIVGTLLLAGVLGLVLLFSSGTFGALFASTGDPARAPRATPLPGTPTVTVTTTTTTTPTPTTSPTPTPELVTVPNIVGRTEVQARELLAQEDLTGVAGESRHSNEPPGQVIEQSVPAGTQVEAGQSVTYVVSLGPNLVEVPDLTGVRLDFARQQAEQRGLSVNVVEQPSQQVSEGFVIRQDPRAGLRLQPGDTIALVVSIGDKVQVPELTGMSEDAAKARLAQTDGLSWIYTDLQNSPDLARYRPGDVVSMSNAQGNPIQAGDWVPRGTQIVLGVRGGG